MEKRRTFRPEDILTPQVDEGREIAFKFRLAHKFYHQSSQSILKNPLKQLNQSLLESFPIVWHRNEPSHQTISIIWKRISKQRTESFQSLQ